MLPIHFDFPADRPLRLLCLGAHPDDLEIGCGGTVLLLTARHQVDCTWVVFSGAGPREAEARQGAAAVLERATASRITVEKFQDGFFPAQWAALKERFERIGAETAPDLILTHHRNDRHQDHRTLADLTWNTWRDHLILEYEVPKYEGDLQHPNLYIPLDAGTADRKVDILAQCFGSQQHKHWFDVETFRGLMRLRGLECRAPERYAEAFHASKVLVS